MCKCNYLKNKYTLKFAEEVPRRHDSDHLMYSSVHCHLPQAQYSLPSYQCMFHCAVPEENHIPQRNSQIFSTIAVMVGHGRCFL